MSAKILDNVKCKDCGFPVIDACCNGSFTNFKDAGDWDWWKYCSNKGCKNHEGQGVFQDIPEWIESTIVTPEMHYKWIQEREDKPPYKVDILA